MEILEAFKAVVPVRNEALIYEFRGRYLKPEETPQQTGRIVIPGKSKKFRSVYVAAENLYDAIFHLRTYRSNFLAHEALFRGRMKIENRDRKAAMKSLARRLRKAEQQVNIT